MVAPVVAQRHHRFSLFPVTFPLFFLLFPFTKFVAESMEWARLPVRPTSAAPPALRAQRCIRGSPPRLLTRLRRTRAASLNRKSAGIVKQRSRRPRGSSTPRSASGYCCSPQGASRFRTRPRLTLAVLRMRVDAAKLHVQIHAGCGRRCLEAKHHPVQLDISHDEPWSPKPLSRGQHSLLVLYRCRRP